MEMFNKIIDRRKFLKLMLAAGSVICGTNAYGFLKLENKDKLKLVLGNNSDSIFIGDIEAVTNEVYVHFYNPKDVVKVTNETIEVNLEILCSKLLPVNEIVLYLDNEYLMTRLREKVLGRVDLGDTDESGLHELVEKSQEILADLEIIAEKQLLEKFFNTLGKTPEMAPYKLDAVKDALTKGAVDILILSKKIDRDVAMELKEMAKRIGSTVEIVSVETEEGLQFKNLSGTGAILRFRVS